MWNLEECIGREQRTFRAVKIISVWHYNDENMSVYICPNSEWMGASQVALTVKNPPANAGDMRRGFDPWVGRSPGEANGNPFQYSCLGNLMDRGIW